MKKLFALLLALAMVLSLVACGNSNNEETQPAGTEAAAEATTPTGPVYEYTFHTSMTALGNNWNPHAWEMSNEDTMMSYVLAPLATMSIEDSINGIYQWVYVAADSITDVTADHQDDLGSQPLGWPSDL